MSLRDEYMAAKNGTKDVPWMLREANNALQIFAEDLPDTIRRAARRLRQGETIYPGSEASFTLKTQASYLQFDHLQAQLEKLPGYIKLMEIASDPGIDVQIVMTAATHNLMASFADPAIAVTVNPEQPFSDSVLALQAKDERREIAIGQDRARQHNKPKLSLPRPAQ